jgi:urea transport system ATP-binding protein
MVEPLLLIEDLVVDFDGFKAVDGFSMAIDPGELRVLIGANGAGKTTLMDLISSKTKATGGRIVFKGQNITNWSEHKIARAGIGRKFQVPSIFKELTVRQNYQVATSNRPGVLHNVFERPAREGRERIEEVLEMVGLESEAETVAGNLSHGQTQWMELGMVLVQRPELILLDEPTAGMTAQETEKTSRIINDLRGAHTLLIVEHDMSFVRSICQTITVMHMGRKLAEGPVETVEHDAAVREAYLGSGGLGRA